MIETRWQFGYKCEVVNCMRAWHYIVYVPSSHPVRVDGLGDLFVFKTYRGWTVVGDDYVDRVGALDAAQMVAAKLRSLQNAWDQLSPYEREYRIW